MKCHDCKISRCVLLLGLLICTAVVFLFGHSYTAIDAAQTKSGDTERRNIALNASVTCSSSRPDPEGFWKNEFLTDGDKMGSWPLPAGRTLGWRSAICDTRDVEMTVLIDCAVPQNAEEIILYPRGNGGSCFPDDFTVEISRDGQTWETVASVTGDTAVEERGRSFTFSEKSMRYAKITVTKLSEETDGADRVCEISEIEIWGRNGAVMQLNKNEIWMGTGSTDRIVPTVSGNDNENGGYIFEFTSEDDSVVDIDSDGQLRALKEGNTNIRVTEKTTGLSEKCAVKVYDKEYDNILITVPVWGNENVITEEQFRMLRDADVNGVVAVGHDMQQYLTDRMLETAKTIWDDDRDWNLGVFIHSYTQGITPASSEREIREYAEYYRNTPALMGYHIEDEPFNAIPYAEIERILRQNDPSSIADINFLPGQAYKNYNEYYGKLSDYAKLVGEYRSYLSFDNYPFGVQPGSVDEYALFGNFEAVRRAGLDNNTPTAFYLQAVGSDHFGYRRPDEGVLRYHIASAMAYGFKWIKYYSWYVPGASGTNEGSMYFDAVMDHDGEKTELYDVAAKLNKEVHNVGETLAPLDAIEVYHTGSKSTGSVYKKLPDDFFAQPVGDCQAIVSLMEDPMTGKQYLMLVNKNFTESVTMRFSLAGTASVIELDKSTKNGTLTPDWSDGILTRTFLPGEFALYELPAGDHSTRIEKADNENLLTGVLSTASASYSDDGWYIGNVHDGTAFSEKDSMGWKVETDTGSDNWIMFDLGENRSMNRLDVYPAGIKEASGNLFPRALRLFVSDNGSEWNLVFEQTDIEQPTTEVPVFRFDTVSARYVRIVFPSAGNIALSELALYFDNGNVPMPSKTTYVKPEAEPGVNLAAGKPVKASESYQDTVWAPEFATDGVAMQSWPTTRTLGWCAGFFGSRETDGIWIRVDLEAVYSVNKVILFPRGNGGICFPSDYKIQVSLDGLQWTSVAEITGDENKGEQERVIEFDTVEAKYVRLLATKLGPETDGADYSCQISEFEVYYDEEPGGDEKPGSDDKPGNPVTADKRMLSAVFSALLLVMSAIVFIRKRISG